MANFSNEKINDIWENAQKVEGADPNVWRKDVCDAWIKKDQYGKENDYGWEIDHALPIAKKGTDNTANLRAMHWKNNRSKGDDFPSYTAAITSEKNKNIEKEVSKTIHQSTLNILKKIYTDNPNL